MDQSATEQSRQYEAVIIMHPDATEEEQKALFRKNGDIVRTFKGEVHHLDTWGKRRLANPIEKLARGVYFHTTFTAQGNAVAELERTMGINDRVLRFSHLRLDDRVSLPKYVESFKAALVETLKRESEREAKAQARRAFGGHGRGGEGGGREGFDRGGEGRGEGGGRGGQGGGFRRREEGGGGGRDFPRDFGGGDEGEGE
jgi:small subunit ribosomal protein S6